MDRLPDDVRAPLPDLTRATLQAIADLGRARPLPDTERPSLETYTRLDLRGRHLRQRVGMNWRSR